LGEQESAGFRTVPIEVGKHYLEEGWGQQLMTVRDFIEKHIQGDSDEIGYLAQTQLFEQIPQLRKGKRHHTYTHAIVFRNECFVANCRLM
jgi:hypothetical protein